ncbi:MAG: AAA family ATPase [Candidatus Thermoplasmatota archaeon]
MLVVGITGMPGAGKSEAVAICKELGFAVFRMGNCVWEEAVKNNLKIDDENVGRTADLFRKKYGMDIWAKKTLEKINIEKKLSKGIIIDGIRNVEEVEIFRNAFDKFVLLAIYAPRALRYKRLRKRKRKDDAEEYKKFMDRENRELGWGIGNVIALSDIIVSNTGSIKRFRNEIRKILMNLLGKIT